MDVQTSTVEYLSEGERIQAFLARPPSGRYPAIIVIHEIWGLVDHIKDVASRFGREGYAGLAVDLFGGRSFTDIREGQKYVAALSDSKVMGILGDARSYLSSQPFVRDNVIGVIGFCMGGRYSLLMACHNPLLRACSVFYGRPVNREINDKTPQRPIDLVSRITCPILGVYGEADEAILPDVVKRLKAELQKQGKV